MSIMCGILGSINSPFERGVLDSIAHRGPDDFGIKSFGVNNNNVQFGQRRLSIIDVSSAGHQPMCTEGDNYAIVFNGEIYNHLCLRSELPKSIQFKGHSDTETILYYLREFGINAIGKFNGIFSIAFLDKSNSRLYLARDPFGVKPLYYFHAKDIMIFSSEIRPIEKMRVAKEISKQALASTLRLRFNPAPETVFKNIYKLKPGHFIEIDLSKSPFITKEHFYGSVLPRTSRRPYKNIKAEYGSKIEIAVKRQLLSDVEIGVLLSGGVDSAVIAALAQKNSKSKLKAFTIGFEGDFSEDEIADAAETAELLGLEHHYKRINFTDFLAVMRKCVRIVEEPLATTSIIPMFYLSELASKYVKVVLTGQGADEPLGGYKRYKSEIIYSSIPFLLQRPLKKILSVAATNNEKLERGIKGLGTKDDIKRFIQVYEVFTQNEIETLLSFSDILSHKRIEYLYDKLECHHKTHSVERMMGLDTRLNLSDDLLNYTDKITMNFSLECRVPMLDLELVNFIESLRYKHKINLKSTKIIHKSFAKTVLPSKIVNRKKKGFQSPTEIWFRTNVDQIREMLLDTNTNFARTFNQKYIEHLLETHQNGLNKEKQIFLLLSIYFLLD